MIDDENDGDGGGLPLTGNPYIGEQLCEARRATLEQKIISLRNQIVGAIALSTMILTLVFYLK